MNKNNYILKFLLASVVTLLLVLCIVYLFVWNNNNKLHGKLVFSETYNRGILIDRIKLVSAEDTVDIVRKGDYWVIENKNDYYADFILVNGLLNSLNKSIYSMSFPFNQEIADEKFLNTPDKDKQNSGIIIKTFIKDEKVDEMIIGLSDESKNYYFARNLKDDNIWLISEDFNIPVYTKDWIVKPIVSIPTKQIENIQIDNVQVKRFDEYTPFYDDKDIIVQVDILTDIFSRLFVANVVNEAQFENIKSDTMKTKNIKVTTFLGLVFDFDLYYSGSDEVWCKIKLSTTSLPKTIINDYINDNKFLYDGWYFEISPEQGHILRDFRLM